MNDRPRHSRNASRRRGRARVLLAIALLAVLLVASGWAYQGWRERVDRERFPPPGALLDVGDRSLHMHCLGSGTPVVVLEAGLGNGVTHWRAVQEGLANRVRVCAYDRAGLGWSDPGPLPRTSDTVVDDLARLLERSAESGPYVLVGHSNGGPYVRLFAARYPERTAGMVLVDPAPESGPVCVPPSSAARIIYGTLVGAAPLGLARLLLPVMFPLRDSGLPPEDRAAFSAHRARSAALRTVRSEAQGSCALLEAASSLPRPPDAVPFVVLSAGARAIDDPVTEAHRRMAAATPAGRFERIEGSAHWIQLEEPAAVIEAVERIVGVVRASDRER